MSMYVDQQEAIQSLRAILTARPDLLSELDELFLGNQARYESSGVFIYFFVLPAASAVRADGQNVAFRPRDKSERDAVLLAPNEHGLIPRFGVPQEAER